ncbi:hypothetical protein SS41_23265 [Enterobacter hormaechei subsp. xiangfangensis]|uniref:hypothetical protein n=1 Tax=Enterobacter hormaechei TaxID=158836 RepID=UPI0005EEFF72|nr:hypothetical protein [Enterobacter hormaechei]KJN19177.1 hypothetical protein SS41_23265 [Enterobacter hormaechei subsp. xiangfangensis]
MKLFEKNTSIIDYQIILNEKYHLEYKLKNGNDYISIKETSDAKKNYFNNLIKSNKFIELDDNEAIVNNIIGEMFNKEDIFDCFMTHKQSEPLNTLINQVKSKIEFLDIYRKIGKINTEELEGENSKKLNNINKNKKRL